MRRLLFFAGLLALHACTRQSTVAFLLEGSCTPTSCSGHGVCSAGEDRPSCECDEGYAGTDCSQPNGPEYDGAGLGIIPEYALTFDAGLLDGGTVVVDTTCCLTHFRVSDLEPADAIGALTGEVEVLRAPVPLTRTDAGWMVDVCFPIKTGAAYWYRFEWDGGAVDAGEGDLEDGGYGTILLPVTVRSERASDSEPRFATSSGYRNYYSALDTCAGHDGGVP